jgi:hypothetical protein
MIPVDAASNPFKTSRRFHRGVMTVEYSPDSGSLRLSRGDCNRNRQME